MALSPVDVKIIFGLLSIMIAAFSFIGGLGVRALFKMAADINEIKTNIAVHEKNHESLKENHQTLRHAHEKLEEKVDKIQYQVQELK